MKSGKLDCSLSYAVRRSNSPVAYCALSVRCGTRSEGRFPEGIAHFVEHTIFKGTLHRSAPSISSCLDKLGGELNAYTTKEEIVLHATVLKEDLWKAVRLLMELATEATFPQKEIDTERGVVLDEINSYKDSPADDIFDRFEEMVFEGHPLGRRILGSAATVKKISRQNLLDFTSSVFIPSNMALTIVADMDEALLEKKVATMAGHFFPNKAGTTPSAPSAPLEYQHFTKEINKRNHEANAVIGGLAPSLYDEHERLTTVLLANILGGPGSNSMLNAALREKNGWVYGVECSYTQYSDTGMIAISLGCDRENLEKCFNAIERITSRLAEEPLSEARMKAARKQLTGQLAISSDNGETQALSMGKSMLAYGEVFSQEENMAAIERITATDIQSMAARLFSKANLSRLVYL